MQTLNIFLSVWVHHPAMTFTLGTAFPCIPPFFHYFLPKPPAPLSFILCSIRHVGSQSQCSPLYCAAIVFVLLRF